MSEREQDIPICPWRSLLKRMINGTVCHKEVRDYALDMAHNWSKEALCTLLLEQIMKESEKNNPEARLKRVPNFIKWLYKI